MAQARTIARYASDMPISDDWQLIQGLACGLNPAWLLARTCPHRMLSTKVMSWATLCLAQWDLRYAIAINYATTVTLAALIVFLCWRGSRGPLSVAILSAVPLFSPLNGVSQLWVTSTCYLHYVFALVIAPLLLFSPPPSHGAARRLGCWRFWWQ